MIDPSDAAAIQVDYTMEDLGTDACPICRKSTRRVFEVHGYWVRECRACVHRFAECAPTSSHAADVYGANYFEGGGDGYNDYLDKSQSLIRRGEFYGRLAKQRLSMTSGSGDSGEGPGRVLDVGAAAGFVLEGYRRQGWIGRGVEPNPEIVDFANQEWELPVDCTTLEGLRSSETFDLVSMIQVVAHFHDVRAAFAKAASLTKDDGHWLVETWDHRSLTARIRGEHWHEYSPPSVLQMFSRASLRRLAEQFGMQYVDSRRTVKSIAAGRAGSLLQHKADRSWVNGMAARAIKMLPKDMNIPYLADDLFWMLFKKDGSVT